MKRIAPLLLLLPAAPAWAHHPLAGQPMETFTHALLSGIGHPVLGFDHLFFVLAVGLATMLAGLPRIGPLAFIAAMLVGCGAQYAGLGFALREPVIALSLLVVGGVLASGRAPAPTALIALFAGFGLFHGAAFASSIAAQEGGVSAIVLTGYLIGLGGVQYLLARLAGRIGAHTLQSGPSGAVPVQMVGAAVAGVGLFLCLEALEAQLLALLL
ncbi:MAG: urease accessory protein [Paracoccaceae bacterium]|jgi:urease accessory protein